MLPQTISPALTLVAIIEARTFTGPARNLVETARHVRDREQSSAYLPTTLITVATFQREQGREIRHTLRSLRTSSPPITEDANEFVIQSRRLGVEVDIIPQRFRFDPRTIAEIRRTVENRAPHIIQTHNVKAHFLLRLSGLPRAHPWVAFHHGYTATDRKDRLYNHLNRWSLRGADRVVTVCSAFARQLSGTGVDSKRIRVLHNSIVPDALPNASDSEVCVVRSRLNLGTDQRVVLAVGRLSHEKAHVDLVIGLHQLLRLCPKLDVRLIILGEGPERLKIERIAASLGISDRVTLIGHVKHTAPYYAIAHMVVLPSHTEGSPNVLLEAMATSVPVVATAVGGVPEIVTHQESALLVPPREPGALAQAMSVLLSQPDKAAKLAATARDIVIRRHCPDRRLDTLLGIYQELISGTGIPRRQGDVRGVNNEAQGVHGHGGRRVWGD